MNKLRGRQLNPDTRQIDRSGGGRVDGEVGEEDEPCNESSADESRGE